MRVTTLMMLLAGATAGCSATVAEPVAPTALGEAQTPAPKEETWDVFKVELPGLEGRIPFATEGVSIRTRGDVVTVAESGVFDHTHHVLTLGIDCRYCHAPEKPASAATAAGKTCWNCHQNLAVTKDGMKLTHDNFLKVAAPSRVTRRFLARADEKKPGHWELTECDEDNKPRSGTASYRATTKDDGTTRVVTLTPPPPVEVPGLPKPPRAGDVVLHMRKK
ncbi:MAG TPA: cytochrome c3 family protein [Gemmata sp.]|nr:cytochrome c3 family protein [Gemmata sp.]